jgi:flagellar protein FliT
MNSLLMNYYEAIEKASQDMLEAARAGNWDRWSSSRERARS